MGLHGSARYRTTSRTVVAGSEGTVTQPRELTRASVGFIAHKDGHLNIAKHPQIAASIDPPGSDTTILQSLHCNIYCQAFGNTTEVKRDSVIELVHAITVEMPSL
eukprot:TRINITY_DN14889_c0_g1_i1.p2 TRINITY_DN14889_c0_g1~~TRINITY_DN14889_c0_g1_i1.p2  ORF type:complete len:105 (-),score=16.24 TRINITY_DN14889_c0_g1_i1:67-381(-)